MTFRIAHVRFVQVRPGAQTAQRVSHLADQHALVPTGSDRSNSQGTRTFTKQGQNTMKLKPRSFNMRRKKLMTSPRPCTDKQTARYKSFLATFIYLQVCIVPKGNNHCNCAPESAIMCKTSLPVRYWGGCPAVGPWISCLVLGSQLQELWRDLAAREAEPLSCHFVHLSHPFSESGGSPRISDLSVGFSRRPFLQPGHQGHLCTPGGR